jgi:hypothetical protein
VRLAESQPPWGASSYAPGIIDAGRFFAAGPQLSRMIKSASRTTGVVPPRENSLRRIL